MIGVSDVGWDDVGIGFFGVNDVWVVWVDDMSFVGVLGSGEEFCGVFDWYIFGDIDY